MDGRYYASRGAITSMANPVVRSDYRYQFIEMKTLKTGLCRHLLKMAGLTEKDL
jgi:hypothetical protein